MVHFINKATLPVGYTANHTNLVNGDSISHGKNQYLKAISKLPYTGAFYMTHRYAIEKISVEAPHAGTTLNRLIARVERENCLYFHPGEIAQAFDIARTTLEGHFQALREAGAVVPDPVQAHRKRGIVLWRICPYLVWVGTKEAMLDYLKSLPMDHPFHDFREPKE